MWFVYKYSREFYSPAMDIKAGPITEEKKQLHLLIIWLTVSSLSSQNLHLLFSCVLSIFAVTFSFGSFSHQRKLTLFHLSLSDSNYTYTYACRNIFNTIKTSGHSSFRKIYLSLYWKGCVWEGVGDWTEQQHIDPHSSGHNRVSFPFSWAAQPGAWGPSLCWDMLLIPVSSLQLSRALNSN